MKKVNILVGRFQPFTTGHYKCISEALRITKNPTLLCMIETKKSSTNARHPFPSDFLVSLYEEALCKDPAFAGIILVKSANIIDIVKIARDSGFEPVSWTCGTDRYASYSRMTRSYGTQIGLSSLFRCIEIKRGDEDESATQARVSLSTGDEDTFVRLCSPIISLRDSLRHEPYKTMKQYVDKYPVAESIQQLNESILMTAALAGVVLWGLSSVIGGTPIGKSISGVLNSLTTGIGSIFGSLFGGKNKDQKSEKSGKSSASGGSSSSGSGGSDKTEKSVTPKTQSQKSQSDNSATDDFLKLMCGTAGIWMMGKTNETIQQMPEGPEKQKMLELNDKFQGSLVDERGEPVSPQKFVEQAVATISPDPIKPADPEEFFTRPSSQDIQKAETECRAVTAEVQTSTQEDLKNKVDEFKKASATQHKNNTIDYNVAKANMLKAVAKKDPAAIAKAQAALESEGKKLSSNLDKSIQELTQAHQMADEKSKDDIKKQLDDLKKKKNDFNTKFTKDKEKGVKDLYNTKKTLSENKQKELADQRTRALRELEKAKKEKDQEAIDSVSKTLTDINQEAQKDLEELMDAAAESGVDTDPIGKKLEAVMTNAANDGVSVSNAKADIGQKDHDVEVLKMINNRKALLSDLNQALNDGNQEDAQQAAADLKSVDAEIMKKLEDRKKEIGSGDTTQINKDIEAFQQAMDKAQSQINKAENPGSESDAPEVTDNYEEDKKELERKVNNAKAELDDAIHSGNAAAVETAKSEYDSAQQNLQSRVSKQLKDIKTGRIGGDISTVDADLTAVKDAKKKVDGDVESFKKGQDATEDPSQAKKAAEKEYNEKLTSLRGESELAAANFNRVKATGSEEDVTNAAQAWKDARQAEYDYMKAHRDEIKDTEDITKISADMRKISDAINADIPEAETNAQETRKQRESPKGEQEDPTVREKELMNNKRRAEQKLRTALADGTDADVKLAESEFSDADKKYRDFQNSRVEQLTADGKATDAAKIINKLGDADRVNASIETKKAERITKQSNSAFALQLAEKQDKYNGTVSDFRNAVSNAEKDPSPENLKALDDAKAAVEAGAADIRSTINQRIGRDPDNPDVPLQHPGNKTNNIVDLENRLTNSHNSMQSTYEKTKAAAQQKQIEQNTQQTQDKDEKDFQEDLAKKIQERTDAEDELRKAIRTGPASNIEEKKKLMQEKDDAVNKIYTDRITALGNDPSKSDKRKELRDQREKQSHTCDSLRSQADTAQARFATNEKTDSEKKKLAEEETSYNSSISVLDIEELNVKQVLARCEQNSSISDEDASTAKTKLQDIKTRRLQLINNHIEFCEKNNLPTSTFRDRRADIETSDPEKYVNDVQDRITASQLRGQTQKPDPKEETYNEKLHQLDWERVDIQTNITNAITNGNKEELEKLRNDLLSKDDEIIKLHQDRQQEIKDDPHKLRAVQAAENTARRVSSSSQARIDSSITSISTSRKNAEKTLRSEARAEYKEAFDAYRSAVLIGGLNTKADVQRYKNFMTASFNEMQDFYNEQLEELEKGLPDTETEYDQVHNLREKAKENYATAVKNYDKRKEQCAEEGNEDESKLEGEEGNDKNEELGGATSSFTTEEEIKDPENPNKTIKVKARYRRRPYKNNPHKFTYEKTVNGNKSTVSENTYRELRKKWEEKHKTTRVPEHNNNRRSQNLTEALQARMLNITAFIKNCSHT